MDKTDCRVILGNRHRNVGSVCRSYVQPDIYPACACLAGVKQCLSVCVGVCGCVSTNFLKNALSRVTKAFTEVIVNEKQSA